MAENSNYPTERLGMGATAVLAAARQEAQDLGHNYIGQEHLLLALPRIEATASARALAECGVTEELVRSAVLAIIGPGEASEDEAAQAEYTPRLQKALDLAVDEARKMNHYYVSAGHLLLGLIGEGTGVGAGVLHSLGVDPDAARRAVVQILGSGADQPPWLKRYQLTLPLDLFDSVQRIASSEDTTVLEVLRRFIRLGLMVTDQQQRRDAALIIRDEDGDRELILV